MLLAYVTPVYLRVPMRVFVGSLLLILGLIGTYCLIQILACRKIAQFNSFLGAVATTGLLVGLYAAGASRLPVFGHGAGQLAAVTFLAILLVIAGVRAVTGCELMAIPGVFFRKDSELACLIFSSFDRIECKLRSK